MKVIFVELSLAYMSLLVDSSSLDQNDIGGTNKIENFRCVVHDRLDQYLVCNWTLSQSLLNEEKYTIRVQWYMYEYSESSSECPKLTQTSCVWPQHHEDVRDIEYDGKMTITVTLTRNEDQQRIVNFSQKLDLEEQVKPEPVKSLHISLSDKNCIFINWSHPFTYDPEPKFQYKVHIAKESNSKENKIIMKRQEQQSTVCSLDYYTQYKVSVYCKLHRGYWSDAEVSHITTGKHVPSSAPNLPQGSFTKSNVNGRDEYSATIFWEVLPRYLWNAENLHYRVTVTPTSTCSSATQPITEDVQKFQVKFLLDTKCSYNIRLWSQNEVGLSRNSSTLLLKKHEEYPPMPYNVLIAEHNPSDMVNLTWKYQKNTKIQSFTVFWCRSGSILCKGGISSRQVLHNPLSSEQFTSFILKGFPATGYIYGVSANVNANVSSGFNWTDCSGMPRHMLQPPSLSLVPDPERKLVRVIWYPDSCSGIFLTMGYNFSYHLKSCKSSKCADTVEQTYNSNQKYSAIVNDVIPGEKACVFIAVSLHGVRGPQSERCITQTSHNVYISGLMIGITGFLAVAVCVVCVILCLCCRRVQKCYLKEMDVDIPTVEKKPKNLFPKRRHLFMPTYNPVSTS